MSEYCYHADLGIPGSGKYSVVHCFKCGHVSYRTIYDDIQSGSVVIEQIPKDMTPAEYDRLREMSDRILGVFKIPDDILAQMNAQPFPTREEFRNLVRRNCVNGGVNDD